MQTFYSTISQLTATLLGILLAGCAAYFVFFQERQSHFLDEINQHKVTIAETLRAAVPAWPINIAAPIGSLSEEYGSHHRGLGRAALIAQAATDLVFHAPALETDARTVCKRAHVPEDRWRGLTYFWVVEQALFLLTGNPGDDSFAGVFPRSPLGPGYDSWQTEAFDKLAGPLWLLESFSSEPLSEYAAYARTFPNYPQQHLAHVLSSRLTPTLQQVRREVDAIKLGEFQKGKHSFAANINVVALSLLVLMSILTGIVVPLSLLALGIDGSRIWTICLMVAAIAFTVGAFVSFGRDLVRRTKPDEQAALANTLRDQLPEKLQQTYEATRTGQPVTSSAMIDVAISEYANYLAPPIVELLKNHLSLVDQYNQASIAAQQRLLSLTRGILIGHIATARGPSSSELALMDFKSPEILHQKLNQAGTQPQTIVISLLFPRMSTTGIVLDSSAARAADPSGALLFDHIQQSLSASNEWTRLQQVISQIGRNTEHALTQIQNAH